MPRNLTLGAVVVAIVLTFGIAAVSIASPGEHERNAIVVTEDGCADGWDPPASGLHSFHVENRGESSVEVDLIGARQPLLYGSLELVAAGTERELTLRLAPGRYQWRCEHASGVSTLSSAATVGGRRVGYLHATMPVTVDELSAVATALRQQTETALIALAADTDALRAAVDSGGLDQAKTRWLAAHLDYERLGAAYGTFGSFDAKINGSPDGLRGGVSDPNWSGFLALEWALWGGETGPALPRIADRLDRDVHALVIAFPDQFTDVRDVPLRAHEILENTLQSDLTGDDDQGSHTELATARANVEGTRSVVAVLAPLLEERDPQLLASVGRALDGIGALLDGYQRPDGSWLALQSLTRTQREQINATVSEVVERLAPIPDVLEIPRNAGQD